MDVLQNNIKWCIKHNDYYVRDFINMVDDVLRLIYIYKYDNCLMASWVSNLCVCQKIY